MKTHKLRLVLALTLLTVVPACGSSPLNLLTGGGPNVAANVQAGKTNSQTVGTTENTSQKIVRPRARDIRQSSDKNSVRSDAVENLTVNETPLWVILLLILGWLFPSPGEIGRFIRSLFKKERSSGAP